MRVVKWLLGTIVLVLAVAIAVLSLRPTRHNAATAPGFEPLRDDALAARFAPVVVSGAFERPVRLLYRAARDAAGRIRIVYHFVWEYERNSGPGFGPFMSRWIYTGGLGLQGIMFGKGDIETVSLVIGRGGAVEELAYETAENYDPRDFGVRHRTVRVRAPEALPGALRVMSWNHLFEPLVTESEGASGSRAKLRCEYFTEALWKEYTMFKPVETFFRRSRAHEPFERVAAP